VLIPKSNVKHLMLRKDVIDSVSAGEFHIYPVEHVDEGIEILTGVEAGIPDKEGHYPQGTINAKVKSRLEKMAKRLTDFSKQKENDSE